ncbi:T6SS effector BTH_I2691 family protein, partial [Arhodomonas aquaeolei]|uniref:T6SS effector BTH_I2691 family protein n=1 Tax=Arhodomonas aquaeolei TaxID=2369 RepID=UPI000477805F
MTETDARDYAAEHLCTGLEQGRCRYCERMGLPILPVRYAVCQRTLINASVPGLADAEVAAFTDVRLDEALPEGRRESRELDDEARAQLGESTAWQANKYILRQMRPGYLYLYDEEHPEGLHWYAYAITDTGKFYQFPVAHPPALGELGFPCNDRRNEALNAAFITLPSVETAKRVYYAFTQHPWPLAHIRRIGRDEAWRKRHMQSLDIPAWVAGRSVPHAFGVDTLAERVAEYSPGRWALYTHFFASGYQAIDYDAEALREAMDARLAHAAARYQGRGLILAVNDELGIIDELNAYRHQALAGLEAFLDADGGANRRRLLGAKAIEAFRNSVHETGDALVEERAQARTPQAELQQIKANYEDRINSAPTPASKQRWQNAYVKAIPLWRNRRAMSQSEYGQAVEQAQRASDRARVDEVVGEYDEQLSDHYRVDDVETFERRYGERLHTARALLEAMDDDYAAWVQAHLGDALARYSEHDYPSGLGATGLVANALRGGIMGSSSATLWQGLSGALGERDAVLVRALFANQRGLIDAAVDAVTAVESGAAFHPDTDPAWLARFETARSGLSTREREQLHNRYPTLLAALLQATGNACAALASHQSAAALRGESRESDSGNATDRDDGHECAAAHAALRTLVRYVQIIEIGDPNVRGDDAQPPSRPVRVTVTVGEYRRWLRQLAHGCTEHSDADEDDKREALHFIDGRGGNFAPPIADNPRRIEVDLPATPEGEAGLEALPEIADEEQARTAMAWAARAELLRANAQASVSKFTGANALGQQVARLITLAGSLGVFDREREHLAEENGWWASVGDTANYIGTGLNVAGDYAAIYAWMISSDAASVLPVTDSPGWRITGRTLGLFTSVLALHDGLSTLSEAAHGRRLGLSAELMGRKTALGAATLTGGIIALLGVPPPFSGAIAVTGMLVTLWLAQGTALLVPPAVGMWLNRSFFGQHRGQLEPYRDLAEAHDALAMVFKGVTVEFTWTPDPAALDWAAGPVPTGPTPSPVPAETTRSPAGRTLYLTITLPDLVAMEVRGAMIRLGDEKILLKF